MVLICVFWGSTHSDNKPTSQGRKITNERLIKEHIKIMPVSLTAGAQILWLTMLLCSTFSHAFLAFDQITAPLHSFDFDIKVPLLKRKSVWASCLHYGMCGMACLCTDSQNRLVKGQCFIHHTDIFVFITRYCYSIEVIKLHDDFLANTLGLLQG